MVNELYIFGNKNFQFQLRDLDSPLVIIHFSPNEVNNLSVRWNAGRTNVKKLKSKIQLQGTFSVLKSWSECQSISLSKIFPGNLVSPHKKCYFFKN